MKDLNYYMNLDYPYVITPITEEDGEKYFQLSIPELPGFKIYEDTCELLFENLEDAKRAWFMANLKAGDEIPEPLKKSVASGRITVRLPKSLHSALSFQAEEEGTSLNSYICYLLGITNAYKVINKNIHNEFIEVKKTIKSTTLGTTQYFINYQQSKNDSNGIESVNKIDSELIKRGVRNYVEIE